MSASVESGDGSEGEDQLIRCHAPQSSRVMHLEVFRCHAPCESEDRFAVTEVPGTSEVGDRGWKSSPWGLKHRKSGLSAAVG